MIRSFILILAVVFAVAAGALILSSFLAPPQLASLRSIQCIACASTSCSFVCLAALRPLAAQRQF